MTRRDFFAAILAPLTQSWPDRPQMGNETMTLEQLTAKIQQYDAYVWVDSRAWKNQREFNAWVADRLPVPGPRLEELKET